MRLSPFLASTLIAVKSVALAQNAFEGNGFEDGPLGFSHAGATNSKVAIGIPDTWTLATDEAENDWTLPKDEESDISLASSSTGLAASKRPPTEEELSDSRTLRLNFESKKLEKLLKQEFGVRPQSDVQFRNAIKEKDGSKLYVLSRCPICLHTMHSSTIASMSCLHEVHKGCVRVTNGHCPVCIHGTRTDENGKPTLLKKALKLFEIGGVIPPKPKIPVIHPLVEAIKQHVELASLIVREVSQAVIQTASLTRKPKTDKRDHHGDRVANFVAQRLRENRPVPQAIWGVTAFDWSLRHLNQKYISSHYKDFGLSAEKYKMLDHVLREFASPSYAFQAYQRLAKQYTAVYRTFTFTVRPGTKPLRRLRSWIDRMSASFRNTLNVARFWNDRLRKSPISPKREKTQHYAVLLAAISNDIDIGFSHLVKDIKPHSSFNGPKNVDWLKMLVALRVLVSTVVDTTIANKSHIMQLFEVHSDLLLACIVREYKGTFTKVKLQSDDGKTVLVNLETIREMADELEKSPAYVDSRNALVRKLNAKMKINSNFH